MFGALPLAVALAALLLPAAGASVGPGSGAHERPLAPRPQVDRTAGGPASAFPTAVRHVYVIVLENEAATSALANGPFERYLATQYAYASRDYAVCHPSAPNYLALTSGAPWQCGSDAYHTYATVNIGDLADAAGLSWAAYIESMPAPCATVDHYPYAVKHNPFVYYDDIAGNSSRCDAHDLPLTDWNSSLAAGNLPSLAYIVPNLLNDGHDTNVPYADRWLRGWLGPDLNASAFATSVFFITYDESAATDTSGFNGTAGGHVYLTAVGPLVQANYSLRAEVAHYDLLTTVEWLLGLGSTGHDDNASAFPPLSGIFGASVPPLAVTANASATTGTAPLAVRFISGPVGGTPPYRYNWSFGDGGASSAADPSHTYLTPGVDIVGLNVTDARNGSASATLAVAVLNASSTFVDRIVATPDHGPVPLLVNLSANVTGGDPPYNDSWTFGDGSPGRGGASVEHTYPTAGNYSVTVRSADLHGAFGAAVGDVVAYPSLGVAIVLDRFETALGAPVTAVAHVAGGPSLARTYRWEVDGMGVGGNSSTLAYVAPGAGAHRLTLVVTDAWGDRAEANSTFEVMANYPSAPAPVELPALPGFGNDPFLGWAIVVGAVAAGVVVVQTRRRRAGPPPGRPVATPRATARGPPGASASPAPSSPRSPR